MTIHLYDINLFLMVFMRMSGAVIFNPLLGRKNIPPMLRAAIGLALAIVVTPTLDASKVHIDNNVQLFFCAFMELIVGLAIGFVVTGLFSVVLIAGELIDTQMGFSMSTFYDPKSGVAMPILGSFFNALLILVFFAGDAHLALIKIVSDSFSVIPPGSAFITKQSAQFLVVMGGDIFELGLRLALPVLAVEMIVQISLGIMMRAVPQINVFSVGIQLTGMIGIVLILILVPILIMLMGRLTSYIVEKSAEFVRLAAAASSG